MWENELFFSFLFSKKLFIYLMRNIFLLLRNLYYKITFKKNNVFLIKRFIYYNGNCPFQEGVFINNCAEDNFAPHRLKFHSASSLIT